MLIVAIESSTVAVSVALADVDGLVARFDAPRSRRHVETIMPALDSLLALVDHTRADISHLCVDVGPGMFTGLRVGVTTAITLAYALNVPVVTVGSLELLAWRVALDGAFTGVIGAALDARRKECFVEVFDVSPGTVSSIVPAATLSPPEAAEVLHGVDCGAVIGDGPQAYQDAFGGFLTMAPFRPDAATASVIALRRLASAIDPGAVALRYIREPDAQIPKDLR